MGDGYLKNQLLTQIPVTFEQVTPPFPPKSGFQDNYDRKPTPDLEKQQQKTYLAELGFSSLPEGDNDHKPKILKKQIVRCHSSLILTKCKSR